MTRHNAEPERVLVVEDDGGLCALLVDEVEDAGYQVRAARSAEEAESLLTDWLPDLVLCDLRLPGSDGLTFLRRTRALTVTPAFILITAFGTVPQAVEALKAGADDFLTKPLDLEHLRLRITRTLELRRLRREVDGYRERLAEGGFHGMVGQSETMQHLFGQIRQVARGLGPVLIQGESGTGKELVARAIHREGPRQDGPFIPVNCAGIPEDLLESEFFGHTAGAFTGAAKARKGLFTEARGGTLFLDEIGEMPAELQAKLLRVLQDGKVRPVGSDREQTVDVRILTATHQDLERAVEEGRFRADLFYRLETFTLRVPPLRERGDDLELLIGRFMAQFCSQLGRESLELAEETLQKLKRYPFPGNVRELRNALERMVTLCQQGPIGPEYLPPRIAATQVQRPATGLVPQPPRLIQQPDDLLTLAEVEERYIRHVLEQVGGNKRRAAALLGIGRRTLYRRLGEEEPLGSD